MIFSLLLIMVFSAIQPADAGSKVVWLDETEYEFGDIPHDEPVQHTFTFKNISGEPLRIDNVRTSCGCTGTTWSFEPVSADSTSTIVLEYDAKQPGYFRKYAKVFFNGQRRAEKLWVTGFVLEE